MAGRLSKFAKNVIVLRGGMSARQLQAVTESLAAIPAGQERVLMATGRYLGEGFDDARLDTLFLTMPISWRGILAQYVGRLHRLYATKRDVVIFDYVDGNEPMLAKMAVKREAGYRSLGYRAASMEELGLESAAGDVTDFLPCRIRRSARTVPRLCYMPIPSRPGGLRRDAIATSVPRDLPAQLPFDHRPPGNPGELAPKSFLPERKILCQNRVWSGRWRRGSPAD